MCCKKHTFLYKKKMLKYESNGNPFFDATWEEIKDITIISAIDRIKTIAEKNGVKFKYKIKPHWMYHNEGKIIIKCKFSHYEVFQFLDTALGSELELNMK